MSTRARTLLFCLGLALALPARPGVAQGFQVASEEVLDLVRRGRALLEGGRAADAEQLFVQADTLGGGGLATRLWILRAWMDQGRINDAFDETDRLSWAGEEGAEIDYLYGMACHRRGLTYVESSVPERTSSATFRDAVRFLVAATESAGARFDDAWLALSESAWYVQDLELALDAGRRAAVLRPHSARAHYVLGRARLADHLVAESDPARVDEADARLALALASLEEAARLALESTPSNPDGSPHFRAEVRRQLGFAQVFAGDLERASTAFAASLALEPDGLDYPQLWEWLTSADSQRLFASTLERARGSRAQRLGSRAKADSEDALLLWWLGRARFAQQDWQRAEEAFSEAVAKRPAYVDSWFYVALSRYQRKDFGGASSALSTLFDLDPANLVARIEERRELRFAIVDWLTGWCRREERFADAARLAQVVAAIEPGSWERWNDVGLLARFAGRTVAAGADESEAERARAQRFFEISLQAYAVARGLAPHLPHLYNDAAVVLQYHLERDLGQARAWYERTLELSDELLAAGTAPEAELDLARAARDDARKNLTDLEP